jgi:CRISPR-associated endoribonuclease Cas6
MIELPDLLSLRLPLRLLPGPSDRLPPDWWGKAVHRLFLSVVNEIDPALASMVHDDPSIEDDTSAQRIRPFTVSSLIGYNARFGLDPDLVYYIRLTALSKDLVNVIKSALTDGPLSPERVIELDYQRFQILGSRRGDTEETQVEVSRQPNLQVASFREISAAKLLGTSQPTRQFRLHFHSPVCFRSGGHTQPLPLPSLVFGSLMQRWNAFAPMEFPLEVRQFVESAVAVSRFEIKSQAIKVSGGVLIGAIGRVTYQALHYDRYWLALLHTLVTFAEYSGIGHKTTMGMGQVRGED